MPLTIPDQSIAAQVIQPPDPMTRISQMLNIQGQRIQNSANQSNLDETNAYRNFAQSGEVKNPDGSLNTQALASRAGIVAPTQGATYAQHALGNQTTQIANESSQFDLHKSYADTAQQTAAGVMNDPRITAEGDKYKPDDAVAALKEARTRMISRGVPDSVAEIAVGQYMGAAHQPGQVRQLLSDSLQGNLGPQGQAGNSLVPNSQQNAPGTDASNNPINVSKDQFGGNPTVSGMRVQGGGVTTPKIYPPNESAATEAPLQAQRTASNTAALGVPDIHTYSQNAIRVMSDPVMLNPNATPGMIAKQAAKLGFPPGTAYKSMLDEVSHNVAKITQANESTMGVNTDAGRQTNGLATGSLEMNPTAMVNALKMGDATASGVAAFNAGQEAAIKGANNSVFASRQFKLDWAQAYSPLVMQILNARKAGDTEEIASIAKKTGYEGDIKQFQFSPQGKELMRRATILGSLTKTGAMPSIQGQQ